MINLQMKIVCYFRDMKVFSGLFAILLVAGITFTVSACKKNNDKTERIIGNYVMHKSGYSSNPFNSTITDYGDERISIVASGNNQVDVLDSSSSAIMTVAYSKEFNEENDYFSKNGEMFFGTYPYEDRILYNINDDSVTIIKMSHYGTSGQSYKKWKGLRIP